MNENNNLNPVSEAVSDYTVPTTPPPIAETALPEYTPVKPLGDTFTRTDAICAWICFALGFVFTRYAAGFPCGIWGGIFWALVGALAAVYAKLKKLSVTKFQTALFAVSEVFCFVPLFSTNAFVNFLAAVFSYLLMFYLAFSVSGAELFGKRFVTDMLKSVLARPFSNYTKAPRAAFSPFKGGKNAKNVLYVTVGLIVALPLTIVVVALLMRSDSAFEGIMDSVFKNLPEFSFGIVWQIIFGVLIGMYLFGMMFAAGKKLEPTAEGQPAYRILPAPIAYAAVTPVCLFYLVYIISQLGYFTAAFGGTLPQGYSYSEFARRGFFELCVIAVINLGIIILMQSFVKRSDSDVRPAALKVYTVVISVFTLLLITSAISKMFLYINEMGMTPLRIYTSWFMLVMAAAFILTIVWQFREIRFWRALFAVFTVMFAALCFGNVDGVIANYNVNAYLSGKLTTVDYGVLEELSAASVKPLSRLYSERTNTLAGEKALDSLRDISEDMEGGFAYFSIPMAIAENELSQYNL